MVFYLVQAVIRHFVISRNFGAKEEVELFLFGQGGFLISLDEKRSEEV